MADELATLGKIPGAFFERVIRPRLGRPDASVRVGPRAGVDCGVIDVGQGQVLVVTTDPFYVVPQFGWRRAAWFAVHILASDLATSGLPPRYAAIDLNLPPAITEAELEALWTGVHETCDELGVAVVTGHTARYAGCEYPMVGGCTMMAVGPADGFVSVGQSRPGDAVIVTKSAAVEAAAIMAVTFRPRVEAAFGPALAARAEEVFWQMSTVRDARAAVRVGLRDRGVTAMHDATEYGVWGGLFEMARAAGVGMDIDGAAVPLDPTIARVCELFAMDPYISISEGTLLVTCVPEAADAVVASLAEAGVAASRVGTCTAAPELRLHRAGRTEILEYPKADPFWGAFAREAAAAAAGPGGAA